MRQPTWTIVAIAAGLVVLIVATTVLVLLVERAGPPQYPPDSPEATVVAFVEALRAADRDQVLALLSSRARAELERREQMEPFYDFDAELRGASESLRTARVRIDRVEVRGGRALVTVTIERTGPALEPSFPFPAVGGGTFSYERTLALVRDGGAWKVDEVAFYF
ncbi:nuclear transport factor 2 family protein [Thermomicrobium sp. 4228-Ro]|uniref:Rv0361 family membrane protein n=1 Tax=Thermomicrobium sp. 4228-Ro TaxID=2993937 RepID=UPI0022497ADA|nr:nuclear transport factor 2 family protein [Thermomicrobium sp. 4228-Ro]MCX2728336.1 nuclear transport factor 2 family protein [Thermomicrobium sp. 4228-Ro]